MEEILKANLERGKKWKAAKELAEFKLTRGEATQKEVDWFDTQPSIVEDIKAYEDSIKPAEEPKPKGKPKKSSEEA